VSDTVTARELLAWIRARPCRRSAPVVAIDGPGGSGKSTLADALAAADSNVVLVRTDDFFLPSAVPRPGVQAIARDFDLRRLRREVLEPLAAGRPGCYRRHDWPSDALAEEHVVEPGSLVVVEGVYSAARLFDRLLDVRLWVDAPREVRLERALARDGEHMQSRWLEEWMPAEERYRRAERPDDRADARIDGTAPGPPWRWRVRDSAAVVAAGYDAIADRYAEWQAQIAGDPRARYVEEMLALLPLRPDILEIGVGGGIEPTPTLARRGRLVAVDISEAQLARARGAVPDAGFIRADITAAEFAPASFDAVVALYVLTNIPRGELPPLVKRIARWLRPGGVFLGTFGAGRPHETVDADWLGAPMFFSGLGEDANERLVREAGLTILRSRVEHQQEPASAPGTEPEPVAFHWILARSASA
jgi:uridine kinase/SAM-dependent methyltransferase